MKFLTAICDHCNTKNRQNLIGNVPTFSLDNLVDLRFFEDIESLEKHYSNTDFLNQHNFFLSPNYFHFLKNYLPKNIKTAFLTLEKSGKLVGFVALQLLHFNAAKSVRQKDNSLSSRLKNWVANRFDFYVLAAGNALLSGEHSIWIDNQQITNEDFYQNYFQKSLDFAAKEFEKKGIRIEVFFAKDFFEPKKMGDTGGGTIFQEFSVDPHFELPIRDNWTSFDHYLDAFHAKARMRVKRAQKKATDLTFKSFNEERIMAFRTEIQDLYDQVSDGAAFNLFRLDVDYFLNFKRQFPEQFQLFGYFKNEDTDRKLVAFFTTIQNGDELEAHFLGYDKSENQEHQIYLNILLKLVELGIDSGAKRVIFGRTASEIKSSIGAEPHALKLYFRHRRGWLNRLFPAIFKRLAPNFDFEPRRPFK